MNRYAYLLKSIGILTLSNFTTKLLRFFLVPLYTSILTTTEYGIYDLFLTIIYMLAVVLTLNIQDAVLRFALENGANRNAIVSIAMKCFLAGCGIVLLGLGVNRIFHLSEIGEKYEVYFFLMFLVHALSGIVFAYTRGVDRIAELSVSSVIASVITIGCNILFLAFFRWGLIGYFLANILGPMLQCLYLILKSHMLGELRLRQRYKSEAKNMLRYSMPMIANSIAWWINNAFDRYIIVFFCGFAENGIYSVASKIPSILNIIQTSFNQAWTLSAVTEFDSDDHSGFFSNTYKAYNCVIVVMCSAIIVSDRILAGFLYARDFYIAWRYVPWLTIAIVFGALSGYIGSVFTAVKDSRMYAKSTVIGAVINLLLNTTMVPLIGALGAAVATTICYIVIWAIRLRHSRRFIKLKINLKRDIMTYCLLIAQAIALLLIAENIQLYLLELGLFSVIFGLYFKDIMNIYSKVKNKAAWRGKSGGSCEDTVR